MAVGIALVTFLLLAAFASSSAASVTDLDLHARLLEEMPSHVREELYAKLKQHTRSNYENAYLWTASYSSDDSICEERLEKVQREGFPTTLQLGDGYCRMELNCSRNMERFPPLVVTGAACFNVYSDYGNPVCWNEESNLVSHCKTKKRYIRILRYRQPDSDHPAAERSLGIGEQEQDQPQPPELSAEPILTTTPTTMPPATEYTVPPSVSDAEFESSGGGALAGGELNPPQTLPQEWNVDNWVTGFEKIVTECSCGA